VCDEPAARGRAWRLLSIGLWVGFSAAVVEVLLPIPAAACVRSERVHEVVAAVDPAWTIHWQAKTSERGGEFRLYGGADAATLRLVDIQQAATGLGGYRFRNAAAGFSWSFYQLRYKTSTGHEVVLANVRVHQVGLHQAPGSVVEAPSSGGKAFSQTGAPFALAFRAQPLPTHVRLEESQRPEPEVPPPRVAA